MLEILQLRLRNQLEISKKSIWNFKTLAQNQHFIGKWTDAMVAS